MLPDRRQSVERFAANRRLRRKLVQHYRAFLLMFFGVGDWFVTITFRDRHQDSLRESLPGMSDQKLGTSEYAQAKLTRCAPDPRLDDWEPDSKYRYKPGPPVRDAALREIQHYLLELGWEAAGHTRQEIFNRVADGLYGSERTRFARVLSERKQCLICAVLKDPATLSFYYDIERVATGSIGWVIAEELGKVGGRWHVHVLVRGVQHLRRKKYWKRAFVRFGRSRIEPIHE
jgi:hypothetical protein